MSVPAAVIESFTHDRLHNSVMAQTEVALVSKGNSQR